MGIIAASMFLTLDGVYQAPGGREEDPSGAFPYGGWQAEFLDDESGADIGADIDRMDALLLGRRTYDIFAGYWPRVPADNPIAAKFAQVPKFVVSRTLADPDWQGTTVLPDAATAARLRDRFDEVQVIGSGSLLQSLFTADAVDRLQLWTYPVTLGEGKRLFGPGTIPAAFRLVRARAYPGGAVGAVYERSGDLVLRDMDDGIEPAG
ncbi:dihydrofolate reductase family protein [Agromyces larvae]|uniref:Dihydrofolate reductase family protein n=1 Tax=Agromyces larvae TaxID=2929802 RepID=A0ABY4BY88_9MICO|nr:dihydrofolate reductase family protein [Agromyces larvae]UOE44089.1 dihydrofolate reductase family protein [Agromyces larvae]